MRREDELERHVREVVDRAVGVAVDVVVDIERLLVLDAIGAHHARVAHVDHIVRRHVHEDPERHERDEADREPAGASVWDQRIAPDPWTQAGPEHPHEQVAEHRIDQRHGREHQPLVEEEVRDAEREQHQQVQMEQAERPPQVEEGRHEQHTQRQPDPPAVGEPREVPAGLRGPHGPLIGSRGRRLDLRQTS
jgi:hypothetical protein